MLRDRLFSAACLISVVTTCLLLDYWQVIFGGGVWLLPLVLICAGGTAWEMSKIVTQAGFPVRNGIVMLGAVLGVAICAVPIGWEMCGQAYPANCPVGRTGWVAIGTMVATAMVLVIEMACYEAGAKLGLPRIIASLGIFAYVTIPFGFLVVLRQGGSSPAWGLAAVVSLVATTKAGDTGAYFVGKMLGRHKLIPKLSPGKTWEGAVGGVLFSVFVGFACFQWLFPALGNGPSSYPYWGPVVLGITCAVAGMAGDLTESLFKRDAGCKDSGAILPGMGGIWDVTDSLIGASVPGYLCFVAGVAGPWT